MLSLRMKTRDVLEQSIEDGGALKVLTMACKSSVTSLDDRGEGSRHCGAP